MKKSILIFALALFLHLSFLSAQSFKLSPMQPQPIEKMTINYNPAGSDLEGMDVYAVAYVLVTNEDPKAYDVPLFKSDNGYTANFQTSINAQAVYFKFENEDGSKTDNNNDEGYSTLMYKNGIPVNHAHTALSTAYARYAGLFGIKGNGNKAMELIKSGLAKPSDRFNTDNLTQYAVAVRLAKDEKAKAEILEHINSTFAKGKLTEKEMQKLSMAAQSMNDKELSKKIEDKIITDFPEGKAATYAKYAGFRKLEKFEDKLAMYEEAYAKYKDNADYKIMLDNMERTIASAYGKKGEFKSMYDYAGRMSDKRGEAGVYNGIAWGCSGESIEGEGHHIKDGAEMSMKSLNLIEKEIATMDGKLPAYSKREWTRSLKYSYAMFSDTYALLAYKNGDVKSAVKYQKIACETSDMGDAAMNARYAIFMEKDKGPKETMAFLEDMISKGYADSAMKAQFTRLFKANVSIDEASEMYIANLEAKAKEHKIKEIKEEMVNKKAPVFALKNLKGEEVSLESLKGKVVIVDFWATWCGPCKASFPGMQKAVTKYDKSEDVAFVFVDTWESGKKKEENAQKFIDGKGYTFNVLMDNDNKMVADYGVSGIPTKFILDQEGNIRFRSSGFNGNDDALVDEISIVVELLRGGESGNAHKAGVQPNP